MLVKITRGHFGNRVNGHIKAVGAGETVDVPKSIAERLVREGVGEYVDSFAAVDTITADEEEPLYGETSTAAELRRAAAEVGIRFKAGTSKADMLAALDKYYGVTE